MEVDFKNCQDISDFSHICRICLSKDDLYPVTLCNYDDNSVVSLLKICSNIEVVDDHLFPPNICSTCLGDLIMIYKFQIKCKLTFEYLHKLLKENKDLIEVIDVCEENETISDVNVDPLSLENTSIEIEARDLQSNRTGKNEVCAFCDVKFRTKTARWSHMRRAHPGRKVNDCLKIQYGDKRSCKCSDCNISRKKKSFLCSLCGKQFTQNQNLKRHMMIHSGERPFTCNICSKGFIRQCSLQDHLKVHNKNTKQRQTMTIFKCDYCERQFKIKLFYKNHLKEAHREHYKEHYDNNEKEFSCDKCEKIFSNKKTLKQHMVRHGEKHVLCPDCGKEFYTEAACISHQRIHTGEKPFECNVCGKSFRYQSSFDTHKRVHDGVRAYFCKECPKTFVQAGHLKNHIKSVHNDEKSHTCLYCKKSFTLKHNLNVHIRIHTGETPFTCPVCKKGFFDSSSRKKHIKSQHKFFEVNNDSLSKDTQ